MPIAADATQDANKFEQEGKQAQDDATEAKIGNCFVAGTPVLMADGTLKSIEQVHVGDLVESKNPVTGKQDAKRVIRTFHKLAPVILTLMLGSGERIATTPGHPFATSNSGNFVLAGNLPLKSQLQEFDGHTATLASETTQKGPTPIFNFEVEDWHTYFVGQSHLWVHNASTPTGNAQLGQLIKDVAASGETAAEKVQMLIDGAANIPGIEFTHDTSPFIQGDLFFGQPNAAGGVPMLFVDAEGVIWQGAQSSYRIVDGLPKVVTSEMRPLS